MLIGQLPGGDKRAIWPDPISLGVAFDQVARDKGGDWARSVADLWEVSMNLISGGGKKSDYIEAMKNVASAASIQSEFPDEE